MKNLLYFLLGIGLLTSCAPATTTTTSSTTSITRVTEVVSPAGQWNYTITGTPDGDFAGIMTITETGQRLDATITISGTDVPIQNFAYTKETKKLTGELHYSGMVIAFDALLTTSELNGAMSEGGMNFPFKATRIK